MATNLSLYFRNLQVGSLQGLAGGGNLIFPVPPPLPFLLSPTLAAPTASPLFLHSSLLPTY